MTWTELEDINTSAGIHTLFTYAAETVPIFMPLTLFAFFTVAFIGSYIFQIRTRGFGDAPASFAASGFITAILATMFSFLELVNLATLVITYGIAIVGVLWLYTSKE